MTRSMSRILDQMTCPWFPGQPKVHASDADIIYPSAHDFGHEHNADSGVPSLQRRSVTFSDDTHDHSHFRTDNRSYERCTTHHSVALVQTSSALIRSSNHTTLLAKHEPLDCFSPTTQEPTPLDWHSAQTTVLKHSIQRHASPIVSSGTAFYANVVARQIQANHQADKHKHLQAKTLPKSPEKHHFPESFPTVSSLITCLLAIFAVVIVSWQMCIWLQCEHRGDDPALCLVIFPIYIFLFITQTFYTITHICINTYTHEHIYD